MIGPDSPAPKNLPGEAMAVTANPQDGLVEIRFPPQISWVALTVPKTRALIALLEKKLQQIEGR